ncbi:MAG: alpha/beta hydrolase [bacterium]|nr:alpha/beta hydrolase [bacterium]
MPGSISGHVEGIDIEYHFEHKPESDNLIICFHGLVCTKESFRYILKNSLFNDSSILLIDLPGFGDSSRPENFSYTMEDQAEVCEKLIGRFPYSRYHLAAHSMGGAAALLFSPEFYKKVLTFSNLEGNLIAEDCGMFSKTVISVPEDEFISDLYEELRKQLEEYEILRFDKTTPEVIYKSSASLVEWSESGKLLEKFKDLNVRKAYFYGEENQGMEILQKLSSVPAMMIPNADHSMMVENPGVFYEKLAEFIYSR